MRSLLATILVLGLACNSDEPPPPAPKQVERVDTAKIPFPEHTPEMLGDPGKPRRVAAPGSLDVTVAGKMQHFVHMPKGVNAAARFDDKDVAWIRVTGQATTESGPTVRIALEHVRVDELQFPVTFKTSDKGKSKLTLRYELDPARYWEAKSAKESSNVAEVTLTKFDGKRLAGTFAGTLDSNNPQVAKPLELTAGSFEVELRLRNIGDGKAADGPS